MSLSVGELPQARLKLFASQEEADRWPHYHQFGGLLSGGDFDKCRKALCPKSSCPGLVGLVTAVWCIKAGESWPGAPRWVLSLRQDFTLHDGGAYQRSKRVTDTGKALGRRTRPANLRTLGGPQGTVSTAAQVSEIPPEGVVVVCPEARCGLRFLVRSPKGVSVVTALAGDYWYPNARIWLSQR